MDAVIFTHSSAGILLVTDLDFLKLTDQEIGEQIKNYLEKNNPTLLDRLGLSDYELISVDRLKGGKVAIQIIGDEGILYIDAVTKPIFQVQSKEFIPEQVAAAT